MPRPYSARPAACPSIHGNRRFLDNQGVRFALDDRISGVLHYPAARLRGFGTPCVWQSTHWKK
jgi:hypothetical protein